MRGEHYEGLEAYVQAQGPPPRARGAHDNTASTGPRNGTTPACAGSTLDHRGGRRLAPGPPPRARGAPAATPARPGLAGTTPACAGSTPARTRASVSTRDHPRVRGEHHRVNAARVSPGGPPPRARGALLVPLRCRLERGTTPACAGSTSPPPGSARAFWDHPRVRGEHYLGPCGADLSLGPPPRARGARARDVARDAPVGTTPACAGSTTTSSRPASPSGDHPRVRGEHDHSVIRSASVPGPPPRARGAPYLERGTPHVAGTTPACAGSTAPRRPGARSPGDHPRVRGEHLSRNSRAASALGPPPRARGAPRPRVADVRRLGTTPACAGSTTAPSCRRTASWDHPRVRGEHPKSMSASWSRRGPPPRARGAHRRHTQGPRRAGTTPACAGSTPGPSAGARCAGDHPRVRGEHQPGLQLGRDGEGTTPACAGSTGPP